MNAVFVVIESSSSPTVVTPPGPWQPLVIGSAFSTGDQPDVIWQARLPDDALAAQSAIRSAMSQLDAQEHALATVEQRLRQVVDGAVSFGTTLPLAEQHLLAWVSMGEQPPGGASFGLRDEVQERWQAAQEQFIALSTQVCESLRSYATVETIHGSRLIARTRVNWFGDVQSWLVTDITPVQATLHHKTLTLALRSRAALLRIIGLVGRGAALIATMVASPISALMALPASWQFVQEILAEVQQSMVSST
jgi:hypothetical protein